MKGTWRYKTSILIHAGSILLVSVLAGAAVWAMFSVLMEIGKLIGG